MAGKDGLHLAFLDCSPALPPNLLQAQQQIRALAYRAPLWTRQVLALPPQCEFESRRSSGGISIGPPVLFSAVFHTSGQSVGTARLGLP